jgi:hypothetical protein
VLSSQVVVLEISVTAKTNESLSLVQALSKSVRFELVRAGLRPVSASSIGVAYAAQDLYKSGALDGAKLFDFAEQAEAHFVIVGEYSSSSSEMAFDFAWYDVQDRQTTTTRSAKGKIGLALEEVVADVIAEILEENRAKLESVARREAMELASQQQETSAAAAEEAEDVSQEAISDHSAETAQTVAVASQQPDESTELMIGTPEADPVQTAGLDIPSATVEAPANAREPRRKHIEFSAGFAPFLATGKTSDYFTLGYAVSGMLNLWINLPVGQLGLGVYSGINSFDSMGLISSAKNSLIPFGADVRYVVGGDFPLALSVHLTGGPALLIVEPSFTGRVMKLVPFVGGGFGVSLAIAGLVGVTVDATYMAFFEGSVTIMGFSPSLNLYLSI